MLQSKSEQQQKPIKMSGVMGLSWVEREWSGLRAAIRLLDCCGSRACIDSPTRSVWQRPMFVISHRYTLKRKEISFSQRTKVTLHDISSNDKIFSIMISMSNKTQTILLLLYL